MIQECDIFRMLADNLPDAFAHYRVIFDEEGQPVDYEFLSVNTAFENMTGRKRENIVGKKVTEVMPLIEHCTFDPIGVFGQAILSDRPADMELNCEPIGRHYKIYAYSEGKEFFSVIFSDITDRKEKEKRAKEMNFLHSFSNMLQREKHHLERILKETVELLPLAFWNPEDICASIEMTGRQFATANYKHVSSKLLSPIEVHGEQIGFIEVGHLDLPQKDRDPFLREEKMMLNMAAEHLSRFIEQNQNDTFLQVLNNVLREKPETEQELLHHTLEEALRLTNSKWGYIWYCDEKKGELLLGCCTEENLYPGEIAEVPAGEKMNVEEAGIWGEVLRQRRPVVINDFQPSYAKERSSYSPVPCKFTAVPVFKGDQLVAVTGVGNKDFDYTDVDVLQLTLLMDSVWKVVERKRTEAAALEYQKLAQFTTDSLSYNICVLDERGTIIFVNKSWLAFAEANEGCAEKVREGVNYLSVCEASHGEERAAALRFAEGIRSVIQGERDFFEMEYSCHSPGENRWFIGTVTPHPSPSQGSRKVVIAHNEITERKQAEKALRESEERFRSFTENATDLVISFTEKGIITYISPNCEALTGFARQEYLGREIYSFIHPEDVDKVQQKIQLLLNNYSLKGEQAESVSLVYRARHKEGGFGYLEGRPSVLQEKDGGFELVCIARDITERKLAEEKIRYISFHDGLTGLYNRHFLEELMQKMENERQLPVSMIIADLNGLKLVNDTYGQKMGDEMLKCAAQILKKSCRKEDIIARWGGDEFVILLPQTTEKQAKDLCKQIYETCRNSYVGDMPTSLSLGMAVWDSAQRKLAEVLKEAEDDMYKQKLAENRSTRSTVLNALLKTLEAKSFETEAHTRRMEEVALAIGKKLGLPEAELNRLKLLITLHDIGKINIPEEVLTKKGPLSAAEWEIVKKHPETGFRIARATEEFAHVAEDILCHHERWDGTGYPGGLKGKAIPLLARITALADAYEVMTNGRPYKKAMSSEEVVAELKRCAGTQFDPELVNIFLSVLEEMS